MRSWLWHWGPAIAQIAAIFFLSGQSDVPDLPGGLSSYTGHAVGYALLGALVCRALAKATALNVTRATAWRAVAFSSVYGVTDEFHQSFVANRMPSFGDWIVDTVGAALGVALVMAFASMRRRRAGRNV